LGSAEKRKIEHEQEQEHEHDQIRSKGTLPLPMGEGWGEGEWSQAPDAAVRAAGELLLPTADWPSELDDPLLPQLQRLLQHLQLLFRMAVADVAAM